MAEHWSLPEALLLVLPTKLSYVIGRANNTLLYPGLGLGAILVRAKHIPDGMLAAAARAMLNLVDVHFPGSSLLPQVEDLRSISETVAAAVGKTAIKEGEAGAESEGKEAECGSPYICPLKLKKDLERRRYGESSE